MTVSYPTDHVSQRSTVQKKKKNCRRQHSISKFPKKKCTFFKKKGAISRSRLGPLVVLAYPNCLQKLG